MARRPTADIARPCFPVQVGEKPYQRLARLAFPCLVRQAHAAEPISYGDLAKELDMPNPRNLDFVLGSVGNTIRWLEGEHKQPIPALSLLVFSKGSQLPGAGANGFIRINKLSSLNPTQRKQLFISQQADVFSYPHWLEVLSWLQLTPAPLLTPQQLVAAGDSGGGGESEEHRALKHYVARTPTVVGLPARQAVGQVEHILASADRLDVLFTNSGKSAGQQLIGVEVKSALSNKDDLIRGLFQCVKYKALLEAQQIVAGQVRNVRVILALQAPLPADLYPIKLALGIEVVDGIGTIPVKYYGCS